MAFSPDGRRILSGSLDRTLRLWEVAKRRRLYTFKENIGQVTTVAFSPDGRLALSGHLDHTVQVWAVATGQLVLTFKGHTGPVSSATFSPDGRFVLSGSWDHSLQLWEVATSKVVHHFSEHPEQVTAVAFSPDGELALSGCTDNELRLWAFLWDYAYPEPVAWDEGVQPYLENFLALHTPEPHGWFKRKTLPAWTEADFQRLLSELSHRGYGWLRPQSVWEKLEKMTGQRR